MLGNSSLPSTDLPPKPSNPIPKCWITGSPLKLTPLTHRVQHQVPNQTTPRESHGTFSKVWIPGGARLCWLRPVQTFPQSFPCSARRLAPHPSMLPTSPVPPSFPSRAQRKLSPSWYKCNNLQAARGSLDPELERKDFSKGNIICRGMALLKYPPDLHY